MKTDADLRQTGMRALVQPLGSAIAKRLARGKGLVLVGVKERGRLDPPLENDPDRVALDEPLILDAPVARQFGRIHGSLASQ